MLIWVNGALREMSEATVSVFDHGLTVGDGVFETVKVDDGVPFALRRHLDRLARSAAGLGLPAPDEAELAKACTEVLAHAGPGRLRLRLTYTGGVSPLGSQRGTSGPTLVVAVAPNLQDSEPTTIAVVPWVRNERGALAGLKTTSYGENVVALARARALDASEAIFADTQGRLSEGTGSNIFVVVGGQALTPALNSGCLAGITRALVLEWTDAQEADLGLDVLDEADEVFLVSTTRDVQPVSSIRYDDGRRRDLDTPGPVTARTAAIFAARAAEGSEP